MTMGPSSQRPRRPELAQRRLGPTVLVGAVVAVLLSLLPARLFLGKTYVTLTYALTESARPAALDASVSPGRSLADVATKLHEGLRGRADVELDADQGTLVVEVDDTRRERAKRGIERRAPELRLVDETPALATSFTTFVLPVLVSMLWLLFVRRFDRAHPEPWLLVLLAFGGGLCAAWVAGTLQWLVAHQFPGVPASLQRLADADTAPRDWALASLTALLYAGLLEESCKLAAFFCTVTRRREFDEPVDGIVYAAAISLGFAAAENIRYFGDGNLAPALVVGRAFVAVPTHVFLAAIWGRRLGERLVAKRTRLLPAVLLAILLHAGFDLLSVSVRGAGSFVLPFAVATLSLFLFDGLRSTLRHGPTRTRAALRAEEHGEPERRRFATGSPWRFGLALGAFFATAFGLVAFASAFQVVHPTALISFALIATALVSLLALAGFAVTEALPLDVEVDRHGLRFGGASYPWREVHEAPTPYRRGLLVLTARAPVYVGPLDHAARDELGRHITALREAAPPPSSALGG